MLDLLVPIEGHLEMFRRQLASLSDHAFEFRYPGDFATQAEAAAAIVNCRAVREEVRRMLGLDNPPSGQISLRIEERRARYKARSRKR